MAFLRIYFAIDRPRSIVFGVKLQEPAPKFFDGTIPLKHIWLVQVQLVFPNRNIIFPLSYPVTQEVPNDVKSHH
jgi:hypothetical protein